MLEVKRTMNDSYDNTITICNTFGLEIDCIESCTSIVRMVLRQEKGLIK